MAKKQYFENLLGAMQESILKAHSMIENQHLNVMKRYFDESQKPLTFDIQYPRINPDTGELEYVLVQVPKIALVPMNSLKLKEMMVKAMTAVCWQIFCLPTKRIPIILSM